MRRQLGLRLNLIASVPRRGPRSADLATHVEEVLDEGFGDR